MVYFPVSYRITRDKCEEQFMKISMKKSISFVFVGMLLCLFSVATVTASSSAWGKGKKAFFQEANKALKNAELINAELFAPEAFSEGSEHFKDAEKYYDKGEPEDAGEELEQAVKYLNKSSEIAEKAVGQFKTQIAARNDANKVDAVKYEYKKWNEAEKYFKDAIEEFEDGDLADAREYGKKAEELYRLAELKTIETSYLSQVRDEVEALEALGNSNNAKKIFAKALKLVNKAEEQLGKQRYSNQNASALVKKAAYELKHAKYTHNHIRQMKESDYEFEDLQLEAEKSIDKIAKELGIEARFDRGFDKASYALVKEIQKMKLKISRGERKIASLNDKILGLDAQLSELNNTGEKLRQQRFKAELALKQQKQKQLAKKRKIKNIRATFAHNEGKVLMDGDNVIIRLYGLNFPSGKAIIQPEYFTLLTKVQKSFSKFKNCEVLIEGHTDSSGADALNQKLSEERAEAVRQYILANASIAPEKVNSIGFGETKPLATNETKEGQAKNRRIDVVIIPDEN